MTEDEIENHADWRDLVKTIKERRPKPSEAKNDAGESGQEVVEDEVPGALLKYGSPPKPNYGVPRQEHLDALEEKGWTHGVTHSGEGTNHPAQPFGGKDDYEKIAAKLPDAIALPRLAIVPFHEYTKLRDDPEWIARFGKIPHRVTPDNQTLPQAQEQYAAEGFAALHWTDACFS